MKEFLLYLYCSLSGRSLRYEYVLEDINPNEVMERFREFQIKSGKNENILASVNEQEICILEYYDSGMRYNMQWGGHSVDIKNEILATMSMDGAKLKVVIDITRAFEPRVFTNVLSVLSFILCIGFVVWFGRWATGAVVFNPLMALGVSLVSISVLGIMWSLTRTKYVQMKRRVKEIAGV